MATYNFIKLNVFFIVAEHLLLLCTIMTGSIYKMKMTKVDKYIFLSVEGIQIYCSQAGLIFDSCFENIEMLDKRH